MKWVLILSLAYRYDRNKILFLLESWQFTTFNGSTCVGYFVNEYFSKTSKLAAKIWKR